MKTVVTSMLICGLTIWTASYLFQSKAVQSYSNAMEELSKCRAENTLYKSALGID